MLVTHAQRLDDPAEVRRVIAGHPWATLVTHADDGVLVSHMPAVLAEDGPEDELVVLAHTARADPQTERIEAGRELTIVFLGEHGFTPAAWFGTPGEATGSWQFEAVHVHGVPEVLDRDGSLALLRRTVEHLESFGTERTPWSEMAGTAAEIVGGTCCFRLPVTRVVAKAKLAQDRPPDVRERLVAGLERPGPFQQPALAALMRRAAG